MGPLAEVDEKPPLGRKISVVTCYDYSSARAVAASNIDCILVGDSVAMVMHGHATTLSATTAMIALHTAAVARGAPAKFIVADLPFLAYGMAGAMRYHLAEAQRHGFPREPLSRGLCPLATRPGGVLGRSRAGDRLDRASEAGVRSRCRRLRALVRWRHLQHMLERSRPPRDARPRRAAGDYLRFAACWAEGHAHLSRTSGRDPGAGCDPGQARRHQGRPCGALYADGAGGSDRHARLCAHWRGALGGVWRLRGERARGERLALGTPNQAVLQRVFCLGDFAQV